MYDIGGLSAFLVSFGFSCTFVGSLYVWQWIGRLELPRDHPITVKRRFISVAVTCMVALLVTWYCWNGSFVEFLGSLGIRWEGFIAASVVPLLLTASLFLGPMLMMYFDGSISPIVEVNDILWWRNIVVGPFAEEWVFRSCMIPLLHAAGYSALEIVLISPGLFGLAHVHHIFNHLHKGGKALLKACLVVLLQLCYTSIFGSYSVFLFLRTGHIIAPVLAHMYCNYMGFPDFQDVPSHPKRNVLIVGFLLGVVLFYIGLWPLTEPSMYGSTYWKA